MAGRTTPQEWKYSIKTLQSCPSKLTGMEDVFRILNFSYDSLSDSRLKTCFLYCSLYPEDHDILKHKIIDLWAGRAFLNSFDNIYDARNEEEFIIGSLKHQFLLEKISIPKNFASSEDYFKMHDMIRAMALSLASEEENNILVAEHARLSDEKEIGRWEKARLKVMDLSDNRELAALPARIGELINLQYLNLSATNIRELPFKVRNLIKLRILRLDDMHNLEAIPMGVISSLSSLQVFSRLLGGPSDNELHQQQPFGDINLLEELQSLEHINEIGVTLFTLDSILKFKSYLKLQSCVRGLTIKCQELPLLEIPSSMMSRMEHLEMLILCDCSASEELKICFENQEKIRGSLPDCFRSLQEVRMWNCSSIKNLTWLIYAPKLQVLLLNSCHSFEEILADDFGCSEINENLRIFSQLKRIDFFDLPNLKRICPGSLPFTCLKSIDVISCQSLRELPFNPSSANNNFDAIYGTGEWWDQLEWEDETTQNVFSSKFKELSSRYHENRMEI